eukprot:TRINITY_DN2642_c0_g1_i9.p1 TRINITY_DN2642_c0_g1~~TRINITY_DN2642_c0_g1_i9.p1  ORF type:complete len:163 (+),score=16.69 TRINITY_DN2642_c0_g1_i9:26-490(+)
MGLPLFPRLLANRRQPALFIDLHGCSLLRAETALRFHLNKLASRCSPASPSSSSPSSSSPSSSSPSSSSPSSSSPALPNLNIITGHGHSRVRLPEEIQPSPLRDHIFTFFESIELEAENDPSNPGVVVIRGSALTQWCVYFQTQVLSRAKDSNK